MVVFANIRLLPGDWQLNGIIQKFLKQALIKTLLEVKIHNAILSC